VYVSGCRGRGADTLVRMNIKVTAYFRPTFLIALVWFLWGVNVWVFKKCGIDYAGALGFDKSSTLNPRQICSSALIIGGIYFMLWLLYSFQWPVAGSLFIPAGMYFASFFVYIIAFGYFSPKGEGKTRAGVLCDAFASCDRCTICRSCFGGYLDVSLQSIGRFPGDSLCPVKPFI